MRWFPKIVALVLLGLWLPASAHCLLEKLPALDLIDTCCSSEGPASDPDTCAQDFCGTVESGLYKIEDDAGLAVVVPAGLLNQPFALAPLDVATGPTAQPPAPDPGRLWLFLCRAAPQPRAPSRLA